MDQNTPVAATSKPMDICNCRVRKNNDGIVICNVSGPSAESCRYASPVLSDRYCKHPHIRQILELSNRWRA